MFSHCLFTNSRRPHEISLEIPEMSKSNESNECYEVQVFSHSRIFNSIKRISFNRQTNPESNFSLNLSKRSSVPKMSNKNYFYSRMKELIDDRVNLRYHIKHYVLTAVFFSFGFRSFLYAISLKVANFPYEKYDPLFVFLSTGYPDMSNYIGYYFGLASAISLLIKWSLYRTSSDTLAMQFSYDIAVVSHDQLKLCQLSRRKQQMLLTARIEKEYTRWWNENSNSIWFAMLPECLFRWYCHTKTKIFFKLSMNDVDVRKLRRFRLKTLPNITIKHRIYINSMNRILNYLCYYCLISISLIVVFLSIHYYWIIIRLFSLRWFAHILMAIEIVSFGSSIYYFTDLGILTALMVSTLTFVLINLSDDLNNRFQLEFNRINNYRNNLYRRQFFDNLIWIHNEHGRLCILSIRAGDDIWTNTLFVYAIFNLPSHVLSIFTFLTIDDVLHLMLVNTINIVMLLLNIFPLMKISQLNKSFSQLKHHITATVPLIDNPGYFRTKFKYDDLMNRLTYGPSYGLNMGYIGTITYSLLFRGTCLYIAVLLFAFTHIGYGK
ncbi:hypothetical protein SSS_08842 [Sarcoptes scabiei]|uniref:Gustatory receptor n=1 Tax=Sarcoptes scabiei TaxID=52283 RepID=A0A834R6P5_SARSC|nr:hypothetical protein SSS_08842 [Sarcoptes scabiei]